MKNFIDRLNVLEIVFIYSINTVMTFVVDSPLLLMDLSLYIIGEFLNSLKMSIEKNEKGMKLENKLRKRYSQLVSPLGVEQDSYLLKCCDITDFSLKGRLLGMKKC